MKYLILLTIGVGLYWVRRQRIDYTKLDATQRQYIDNLHPIAKPILAKFIIESEAATNSKIIITSGYRDFATQTRLKAENSKNAGAGYSMHNYGMAIDINVLLENGVKIRKADSKDVWEQTGIVKIADKLGLVWGGRFNGYHDPVHFDISDILKRKYKKNIDDLVLLSKKQFGSLETAQGNKLSI